MVVERGFSVIRADQQSRHRSGLHVGMEIRQRHVGRPRPGRGGRRQLPARPHEVIVFHASGRIRHEIQILFRARGLPVPRIGRDRRRGAIGKGHRQSRPRLQPIHIAIGVDIAIGLPEKDQRRAGRFAAPRDRFASAGKRQIGLRDRLRRLRLVESRQRRRNLGRSQANQPVVRHDDAHAISRGGFRYGGRSGFRRHPGDRARRRHILRSGFDHIGFEGRGPFAQFRIDRHQTVRNHISRARRSGGVAETIDKRRRSEQSGVHPFIRHAQDAAAGLLPFHMPTRPPGRPRVPRPFEVDAAAGRRRHPQRNTRRRGLGHRGASPSEHPSQRSGPHAKPEEPSAGGKPKG